ncbi:MAG: hypothetical protein ACREBU_10740 [Nitrososphaera sp.]
MTREPSMKYFMRIIKVLAEHQQIGLSNLARLSRMNHKRCRAIVKWMEQEGYLVVLSKGGRKTITVTEQGMRYIKNLSSAPVPN